MTSIGMLDLQAQYRSIQKEIDGAIARVVQSQHFILGPEVEGLEREVAAMHATLAAGLERAGLAQERRALRLRVRDLRHAWVGEGQLELSFGLERGAFATAVLRELLDWRAGAG